MTRPESKELYELFDTFYAKTSIYKQISRINSLLTIYLE